MTADSPLPTIGPYRVLRELGRGGMGVVYECESTALPGTRYALKLLLRDDGRSRERFRREGELICRVERHPNVVRVHSAGEHDGRPYLVLDLVEGKSLLDEANARGPVPWRRAFELVEPIARALAFVHERGIVHRDVKPTNILLDREGVPYLTDFGIALAHDLERLTRTNALVGTGRYLAPELMRGASATAQGDVYSLGVVLHEVLTLRHPHGEVSLVDLARRSRERAPPPSTHVPSLPPAVDAVVLRALEPEPARRYPTAEAFARDLRAVLDGRTPAAMPSRAGRSLAVALGAALGLALAFLWIASHATATPDAEAEREALARRAREQAEHARRGTATVGSGTRPARASAASRALDLARSARGDDDPLSFHFFGDIDGLARRASRVLDLLREARAAAPREPLPPELVSFVGRTGHACFERKEFERGVALVNGALELEPRDHALRLDAIRYLKIGGFERADEILDLAKAVLADAQASAPSRADAYDAAVEALWHLGRNAEAEAVLADGLREMPGEAHLLEKRGQVELQHGDRAALETSERFVRLAAGNAFLSVRATRLRARVLLTLAKDGAGALAALHAFFGPEPWTEDPATAEDLALAGCARVLLGDRAGARRDLEQARELEERERWILTTPAEKTIRELARALEEKSPDGK